MARWILKGLLAGLLAGVMACATVNTPLPEPQTIERVPVRRFETWSVSTPITLQITVREAAPTDVRSIEELRAATHRLTGTALGVTSVGAAEAVLMPGYFFAGSLVAGVVLVAPGAIALEILEGGQAKTVLSVLEKSEMMPAVAANLAARAAVAPQGATTVDVDVIVLAFGLVSQSKEAPNNLCLMVDADIAVSIEAREVFREALFLEPYLRSADVPPPICSTLSQFAGHDGERLKAAIGQYVQLLTALVIDRLPVLTWRD